MINFFFKWSAPCFFVVVSKKTKKIIFHLLLLLRQIGGGRSWRRDFPTRSRVRPFYCVYINCVRMNTDGDSHAESAKEGGSGGVKRTQYIMRSPKIKARLMDCNKKTLCCIVRFVLSFVCHWFRSILIPSMITCRPKQHVRPAINGTATLCRSCAWVCTVHCRLLKRLLANVMLMKSNWLLMLRSTEHLNLNIE